MTTYAAGYEEGYKVGRMSGWADGYRVGVIDEREGTVRLQNQSQDDGLREQAGAHLDPTAEARKRWIEAEEASWFAKYPERYKLEQVARNRKHRYMVRLLTAKEGS